MSALPASQLPSVDDNATLSALLPSLLCPSCNDSSDSLNISNQSLECPNCGAAFPLYRCGATAIPWLFADPNLTLLEWKARLNGFLYLNSLDQQRLKEAVKDKRLSKAKKKRLDRLLQAKHEQRKQVLKIIAPLNLEEQEFNPHTDPSQVLASKVAKEQGLLSYYDNIFRDWAWNNGENEQLLKCVTSVLEQTDVHGKVLTIGAGAGRLSYDIHQKYTPELSVLLDINPLLLLAGNKIIQGENISLFELPIAPLNKESFAVEQDCRVDEVVNENIIWMFAEGMNPPFQSQSFDTIVTPWFIDIVPQNLRDFIPRFNRILKIGGKWVNTGSLAFLHRDPTWSYSEGELLELLEKNGFEVTANNWSNIQYLNSPVSAHGRTEKVFSFCATKVRDAVVPTEYQYLPKWILDIGKAIPKQNEYEIQSSKHLLQAQVMGAIDGARSIEQIGTLVAKQYGLPVNEATHAVRRILIDWFEGSVD